MSIRKIISGTCLLTGMILAQVWADSGNAWADADIIVESAPPPARVETVPAPRTGYAWAPGYWAWENDTHVWRSGHWIETHPHEHWVPDRWEKRDEHHWHFSSGHWEND